MCKMIQTEIYRELYFKPFREKKSKNICFRGKIDYLSLLYYQGFQKFSP